MPRGPAEGEELFVGSVSLDQIDNPGFLLSRVGVPLKPIFSTCERRAPYSQPSRGHWEALELHFQLGLTAPTPSFEPAVVPLLTMP